ncbi:hypothetical protein [Methanoregula sp. UBA64]|jgi:hypothetical protein|uniref:hypothetical protein n=1 Tax=Methanoregula sp. UBA64 TaxID=1915554 RepID=UPI0025F859B9|nr:hypothetical protein [Methanoregula sp. UBA64]
MDIPEYLPDIILTAVMVVSTLVLILRFWQDIIIAVAAALMALSLGGLFLSLEIKVRNLEKNVITRERMLRTNLEEISGNMTEKYDKTTAKLEDLVTELSKRAYK